MVACGAFGPVIKLIGTGVAESDKYGLDNVFLGPVIDSGRKFGEVGVRLAAAKLSEIR